MAYRRAFDGWPEGDSLAYSTLAYRFKAVLRQADRRAELEERDAQLERIAKFPIVALAFFDRINALPDLGVKSRPKIFEELAGALSKVGSQARSRSLGLPGPSIRPPFALKNADLRLEVS